ncbi:MAG TPA: hypothetical protein PKH94_05965 [Bacteroidales bacterium]|nr:hypothetical protein [Bacteroidales bacterium]HNS46765.1 hypothetical protein [Bacteroidales bacterium]
MQSQKNKQKEYGQQGRVQVETFHEIAFQQLNEGALQSASGAGYPQHLLVNAGELVVL